MSAIRASDLLPGVARARLVLVALMALGLTAVVITGTIIYASFGLILEAGQYRGPLDQRLPRLAAGSVIALPVLFWAMSLVLQRRNTGRTFHQQAANNRLASTLLMLATLALVAAVGTIIGASLAFEAEAGLFGAALAALVGLLALIVGRYSGGDVVTGLAHARSLEERNLTPGLATERVDVVRHVAREVALAAGIPTPRLLVVDDRSINAFAVGYQPSEASIVLTTGLLEHLDREQLQGVLGHEMGHIRNLDSRFGMTLVVMVGLVAAITDGFLRIILRAWGEGVFFRGAGNSDDARGAVAGFLAGVLFGLFLLLVAGLLKAFAPLFALALQASASREREYLADATAVELTRNPLALERVLEAVRDDRPSPELANRGLQHLWFSNPVRSGSDRTASIFATHPSLQSRIERLRLLRGDAAMLEGVERDRAAAGRMVEVARPDDDMDPDATGKAASGQDPFPSAPLAPFSEDQSRW